MAEKKLNVIVVGGSLGGLFAAVVLKRLGHTVRILEQNPTPLLHDQGAGVMNRQDSQEFLRLHNTTGSDRKVVMCSSARFLDIEGIDIFAVDAMLEMTSWDALYYTLRANFDGVANEYCGAPKQVEGEGEGGRYDYGHRVVDLREKDGRVDVDYLDPKGTPQSTTVDLVIGADGPSSTVRHLLEPGIERKYAGYVAWRGTVPEHAASPAARSTFLHTCCFYYGEDSQILSYIIPGVKGTVEPGQRLINWVWYVNYPPNSAELAELMTDTDGKRHHVTLPVGKMRLEILEKQRVVARKTLSPQFAELVCKTAEPFIQCVTDVLATKNEFFGGKVLLVGDATAGFRPHTTCSTTYAAFSALQLGELMSGNISLPQWSESTMSYARHVQSLGVEMGEISQSRKLSLPQKLKGIAAAQKQLPGNFGSKVKVPLMLWGFLKWRIRGWRRAVRERVWRLVASWGEGRETKRE